MEIKNLFNSPKTNWKYIIILTLFAVIAGAGILAYINKTNQEINSLKSVLEVKTPEKAVKEKIKFFSPTSQDKWEIGNNYQIHWMPSDSTQTVTIELLDLQKRGYYQIVWSVEIPNTGIYSFTVPSDLYPIKYAQLYIVGKSGGGIFSIISKQ